MNFYVRSKRPGPNLKEKPTHIPRLTRIKLAIAVILFIYSGVGSAFIYTRFFESFGMYLPGLVFSFATVAVFCTFQISIDLKQLLKYCVFINLTYIGALFATLFTVWFAFITGFITAAIGALLTFVIINKYIIELRFKKTTAILVGAGSFLITLVIGMVFDKTVVEFFFGFSDSMATAFADIFIFWQISVGTTLIVVIKKSLGNRSENTVG
jgi:hypothetical protein